MAEDGVVIPVSLDPDLASTEQAGEQLGKKLGQILERNTKFDLSKSTKRNEIAAKNLLIQFTQLSDKIHSLQGEQIPIEGKAKEYEVAGKDIQKYTAQLAKLEEQQAKAKAKYDLLKQSLEAKAEERKAKEVERLDKAWQSAEDNAKKYADRQQFLIDQFNGKHAISSDKVVIEQLKEESSAYNNARAQQERYLTLREKLEAKRTELDAKKHEEFINPNEVKQLQTAQTAYESFGSKITTTLNDLAVAKKAQSDIPLINYESSDQALMDLQKLEDLANRLQMTVTSLSAGFDSVPIEGLAEPYDKAVTAMNEAKSALDTYVNDNKDAIAELNQYIAQKVLERNEMLQGKDFAEAFKGEFTKMLMGAESVVPPDVTAKYSEVIAKLRELYQASGEAQIKVSQLGAVLGETPAEIPANQAVTSLGFSAQDAMQPLAKLAQTIVRLGSSAIRTGIDKISAGLKGMRKNSEDSNKSLQKTVKTFIKYTFGVRSFFFLFRKIRSAIADSLKSLQDASFGDVGKSLTDLRASLQYLKDSWAAAFAPIITYVTPLLTRLMDAFSGIMNTIGAFIAMLTGKSFFVKAVKGTGALADKTKAGAEAQKEWNNELYSFDELNRQQEKTDDDKDSGSGSGGGLNFEETPISGALSEWLEDWGRRLKEAWQNSEFYKFGEIVSEGLNKAVDAIDNWIDNTLQPFAVTWSKNIATILNGIVAGLGWVRLGDMIASGLNIIPAVINTFMDTFNFDVFGKRLGEGIKSFVDVVDWEGIGKLFSNKIRALTETIHGIVSTPGIWESIGNAIASFVSGWFNNIPWDKLAETIVLDINGLVSVIYNSIHDIPWLSMAETITQKFNDVVNGIDWKQVGQTFGDFVLLIGGVIVTAFAEIDWQGVGKAIGDFINNIDWLQVVALLVTGLMAFALGVFDLLVGLIQSAFDGLGDLFKNIGLDSIGGFFNGISEKMNGWKEWVKTNMIDPLVDGIKDLLGIHSPSKVFADIGTSVIDGLYQGIKDTWSNITGFFDKTLGPLGQKITDTWESVKTKSGDIWDRLKEGVSKTWDNTKDNLSTTTGNIKSDVTNAWTNLKSTTITSWTNLKNTVSNLWTNLRTTLKSVNFRDIGSNLVNGIKNGVSGAWNSLVTSVQNLCSSLVSRVRGMFQIHSPSRVFADIGENLALGLAQGITDNSKTPVVAAENMADSVSDINTELNSFPNALDSALIKLAQIADSFSNINTTLLSMSNMQIPAVAMGRVIPNYAFAGTQSGNTSLASDIANAIVTALDAQSSQTTQTGTISRPDIKIYIRGKEVFDAVVDENNSAIMRTGVSPLVR